MNSRKFLLSIQSVVFQMSVRFQVQLLTPPTPPSVVLLHALPPSEATDADHEDPGDGVHDDATQLDVPPGLGRGELTVHQPGPHSNPHPGEEDHEEEVHHVAHEAVITPCLLQEPAGLQQRVRDLAAEDDSIDLCGRLPKCQGCCDAQDAHQVVGQHQGTLCLEVHAPTEVEEEVAQAKAQPVYLQSRVW